MAWEVGFPVIFKSGGDTTRVAFGKHIQEIERIYGYLNTLNSSKVEAGDINTAITNAINELKNTWKPSLNFSNISGDLDGSRIINKLTRARIDSSNVDGLEAFVNGKISGIPTPTDKGDGITDILKRQQGCVIFKNGLMIQWGKASTSAVSETNVYFPRSFATIYTVVTSAVTDAYDGSGMAHHDGVKADSMIMKSFSISGFVLWLTKGYDVCYVAVGLA